MSGLYFFSLLLLVFLYFNPGKLLSLFQKSRQQSDKETDSNQNNDFTKTTLDEQKLASSFDVQDAVRNVIIKPETTRRQDDVTGRLPRYTRYTSPRMMKARAHAQDSTLNSHKNVQQKVYNVIRLPQSACQTVRHSDGWTVSRSIGRSTN